ncbi:hypothetical protein [Loktanella sp. Alg231-35]|uniref:hypothetical protein n=1 Tax=Loktanella sp. Alg231-35 TaxID=1922220 RepID=UPI000D5532D8|nr:hypothetical protein [Loktanella sp. Alg231-35]
MTTLIAKLKNAVSNAALFATAIFMVGLGFAFVGTIALFGLIAVGAAMIASFFVTPVMPAQTDAEAAS